jgi:hypothetical protein
MFVNNNKSRSIVHTFKPLVAAEVSSQLYDGDREMEMSKLRELLGKDNYDLEERQKNYIDTYLPFATLHIYCAPCSCLVSTAIEMASKLETKLVKALVRPDSRLKSKCCSEEDGIEHLQGMFREIRLAEAFTPYGVGGAWVSTGTGSGEGRMNLIDRFWLDSHLFDREEEGTANATFSFDESDRSANFIILLGEADILAPEMIKPPFRASARMPRETKIYKWLRQSKRNKQTGMQD